MAIVNTLLPIRADGTGTMDDDWQILSDSGTYTLAVNDDGIYVEIWGQSYSDGTNDIYRVRYSDSQNRTLALLTDIDHTYNDGELDSLTIDAFLQEILHSNDKIYASDLRDVVDAEGGNDLITTYAGNDDVRGGTGDDRIYGGGGSDHLDGEAGDDFMWGGSGDDHFWVEDVDDEVSEGASNGKDTVHSSVSYHLTANVENLVLSGSAADVGTGNNLANKITGSADGNKLYGNGGHDQLIGGGGDDMLFGQAGNDVLFGGADQDTLNGSGGADRFRYTKIGQSEDGSDNRDIIHNFDASDILDLTAIDANENKDGNQAFNFIENSAFSGKAGQLRFAGGILQGDVDGDKDADFEIAIDFNTITKLTADDILL